MTQQEFLEKLKGVYASRGAAQYGGEAVTQLEHGLQAAHFAEQAGAEPTLIAAALLHDVGHLLHGLGEDCFEHGQDDSHEELGFRYLKPYFGPEVLEPIRLHVPAKRYLCATDPNYRSTLSPQSELSLQVQGGPMSPAEVAEFEQNPHGKAAVTLRRWDELAKQVGLATSDYEHFEKYLLMALKSEAS